MEDTLGAIINTATNHPKIALSIQCGALMYLYIFLRNRHNIMRSPIYGFNILLIFVAVGMCLHDFEWDIVYRHQPFPVIQYLLMTLILMCVLALIYNLSGIAIFTSRRVMPAREPNFIQTIRKRLFKELFINRKVSFNVTRHQSIWYILLLILNSIVAAVIGIMVGSSPLYMPFRDIMIVAGFCYTLMILIQMKSPVETFKYLGVCGALFVLLDTYIIVCLNSPFADRLSTYLSVSFYIVYFYFIVAHAYVHMEPVMWSACLVSLAAMNTYLSGVKGGSIHHSWFNLASWLYLAAIFAPVFIFFLLSIKKAEEAEETKKKGLKPKRMLVRPSMNKGWNKYRKQMGKGGLKNA